MLGVTVGSWWGTPAPLHRPPLSCGRLLSRRGGPGRGDDVRGLSGGVIPPCSSSRPSLAHDSAHRRHETAAPAATKAALTRPRLADRGEHDAADQTVRGPGSRRAAALVALGAVPLPVPIQRDRARLLRRSKASGRHVLGIGDLAQRLVRKRPRSSSSGYWVLGDSRCPGSPVARDPFVVIFDRTYVPHCQQSSWRWCAPDWPAAARHDGECAA